MVILLRFWPNGTGSKELNMFLLFNSACVIFQQNLSEIDIMGHIEISPVLVLWLWNPRAPDLIKCGANFKQDTSVNVGLLGCGWIWTASSVERPVTYSLPALKSFFCKETFTSSFRAAEL